MTKEEASIIRLVNQQLSSPQFENPEDVVDWMGMMQAQEYNYFRWAIAMRTKAPKIDALKEAFSLGRIVRLHLSRCTIHVVTPKDYKWISALYRERNLQIIKSLSVYNKAIFSEQYYLEGIAALKEVLVGSQGLSKVSIGEKFARLGLPSDKVHLNQVLLRGEIEGVVCSGIMTSKDATWALTEERIKPLNEEHNVLTQPKALELLAKKYFRSHSPASLEDFCWWSNLSMGQARKAIEGIATEIEEVRVEDAKMYVWKKGLKRIEEEATNHCCLLPPYDEYLIGYKSRWVSINKRHEEKAHNNRGIFYPVVLFGGQVVGNWKATKVRDEQRIEIDLFSKKSTIGKRRIESAITAWQDAQKTTSQHLNPLKKSNPIE